MAENTAANPQRLEQFRKMAEADPNNEVGHFSLGRELLAAGQYDEAVASLRRVVQLNDNHCRLKYHGVSQAGLSRWNGSGIKAIPIHFFASASQRARERMMVSAAETGVPILEVKL